MGKVMLYSYPRTIKSNDEKKGFCKVKGEEVDYIIVDEDEVESCLDQGFYETPGEAIEGGSNEQANVTETTLSLNDLEGKTVDEIKAAYTVEELQVLAKVCDIKRATRMNEDTLVEKLLEKLGE